MHSVSEVAVADDVAGGRGLRRVGEGDVGREGRVSRGGEHPLREGTA